MPNHTFRVMGVAGIMVINFNAATTTATGFEIMVNNVSLPLLASNGEAYGHRERGRYGRY